jgi:DNA-binding transcriptional LysR family regulator
MMTNIDLRLLTIVTELHRTRSVSQTADNLELSQSTVSMSLARLRKHFNDPLFVRTSSGMEPTPHALQLIGLLSHAESLLETALEHHVVFDPAKSDRIFRLCSTDIAKVTMLPKLMRQLKVRAPSVRIELREISEKTSELLESGQLDLAVGFIPPLGAGFCQQRLFPERFVCALRTDHPRVGNRLTLDQFQAEDHLAVSTSGTGHGVVEKALEEKHIRRKIGLRVPGFLGIASIITSTDCLVIVPAQLGNDLAASGEIKVLDLPFQVPAYYVMQHWHERYTHDPAIKWLRAVFAELFLESAGVRNVASA